MGSAGKDSIFMEEANNDDTANKNQDDSIVDLEWTPDLEILLLYSLHGYKPVGPHKHFRMIQIQHRLSNATNKIISSKVIWEKLSSWYDLEALDEAEAEADAVASVEMEFSLPEDEYGELKALKLSGKPIKTEISDNEKETHELSILEFRTEIKGDQAVKIEDNTEIKEVSDVFKETGKKEAAKRGPKKKDTTPLKESVSMKKESVRDIPKKETPNKKEVKESKKLTCKDDDKKETVKKPVNELKKDVGKEDKKEPFAKGAKKETDKKGSEAIKKDVEVKKTEQKKLVEAIKNPRLDVSKPRSETPKQLKTETPKRLETKTLRNETPKSQKSEAIPKSQRVEVLNKRDISADKKSSDKKVETKSPEKTLEPARGAKLRAREKKDTETDKSETVTATKRERSRDSTSKGVEPEETFAKKLKTPILKGRSTRNSIEPQSKPGSPVVNSSSPNKRRTRN